MPVATFCTVNGLLLQEVRAGVESYYIPDTLGSVVEVRNSAGVKTYSAEYYPYGEIQTETGTNPSNFGFGGFLGYFRDVVNLLYVRARHYRPGLGLWQTVDRYWPDEAAYCYVVNQPSNLMDPSGNGDDHLAWLNKLMCCMKTIGAYTLGACVGGLVFIDQALKAFLKGNIKVLVLKEAWACFIGIGAYIGRCISNPATCALPIEVQVACGRAFAACFFGAVIQVLIGLQACMTAKDSDCKPDPDPNPSDDTCVNKCLDKKRGIAHYNCMKNCRENTRYWSP